MVIYKKGHLDLKLSEDIVWTISKDVDIKIKNDLRLSSFKSKFM